MKRQREGDEEFETVATLQGPIPDDCNADQLTLLVDYVHSLYVEKLNAISQNFPFWQTIFSFILKTLPLRAWLNNRTVSKTWNKIILKPKVLAIPQSFHGAINRVVQTFNFINLKINDAAPVDWTLLKKLKKLTVTGTGGAVAWYKLQNFKKMTLLTRLTSLSLLANPTLHEVNIQVLTNLKKLTLDSKPMLSFVPLLTNLTHLDIRVFSAGQLNLEPLRKLRVLVVLPTESCALKCLVPGHVEFRQSRPKPVALGPEKPIHWLDIFHQPKVIPDKPAPPRPDLPIWDVPWNTLLEEFHDYDFDHTDLYNVEQELQKLRAIQLNPLFQCFPTDMWRVIFEHMALDPNTALPEWIWYRVVCKTWKLAITNFDSLKIPPRFQINRILTVFNFKTLEVDQATKDLDLGLFTKLSGLKIFGNPSNLYGAVYNPIWDPLTTLTHLKMLSLDYNPKIPWEAVRQLTNLTELGVQCQGFTTLQGLTNVTSLKLMAPTSITSWNFSDLPRLQNVVSDDPSIFWSGNGTYLFASGTYAGQWMSGKPHGQGTMTITKESVYVGQWYKGDPHGYGTQTLKNGERYEGDWVNGKRSGDGICVYANGSRYQGPWVAGKPEGEGGRWSHPDGEKYFGDFRNGKRHGEGVCDYAYGDQYRGGWVYGQRHGAGVYTTADGKKEAGFWMEDRLRFH
jgi:Leucine-rich repeat (LRR) protein